MTGVRTIAVPDLPEPAGHYSLAVRAQGLLFVSGLLGVRPDQPADGLLDAGAQMAAVLGRLDVILAAAGLDRRDIARVGVYVTAMADWQAVNAACATYFGPHRPARTIVPCPALNHGSLVEVDAVAAYPDGA